MAYRWLYFSILLNGLEVIHSDPEINMGTKLNINLSHLEPIIVSKHQNDLIT